MNRIVLFLCLFGCTHLHAQSAKKEDGIPYRPIAFEMGKTLPVVTMSDNNIIPIQPSTPLPPPIAWKIEYPGGFKGDIVVTIPYTDTTNIKSHFIYRSGHRRTRLIIKRK